MLGGVEKVAGREGMKMEIKRIDSVERTDLIQEITLAPGDNVVRFKPIIITKVDGLLVVSGDITSLVLKRFWAGNEEPLSDLPKPLSAVVGQTLDVQAIAPGVDIALCIENPGTEAVTIKLQLVGVSPVPMGTFKPKRVDPKERTDLEQEITLSPGENTVQFWPQKLTRVDGLQIVSGAENIVYVAVTKFSVGIEEQLLGGPIWLCDIVGEQKLRFPVCDPGTAVTLGLANHSSAPVTIKLRLDGLSVD
jgi:hypothetical protein